MIDKTPKMTVKEAEEEYRLKGHNLRRWIREEKVKAEKLGEEYLIDRASLEAHLGKKNGPKVPTGNTATPVASTPTPTPQLPPTAEPTQPEAPPPPLTEKEPLDLRGGPTGMPSSGTAPRSSAAKEPSEQQTARDRKAQRKEAQREAGKKHRKGPVHYAKDAMRHLDLAQLRDVRDWILIRMDQRMKPL